MIKHVPKITNLNKIRRFFITNKALIKEKDKNYFNSGVCFRLNNHYLSFVGIVSEETNIVFYKELFALEKHLKKKLPKKIKVINKVPLVNAYTMKSLGVRMGKGKGNVKNYYGVVKKNSVFLEILYPKTIARIQCILALEEAISKLSFKASYKFIKY